MDSSYSGKTEQLRYTQNFLTSAALVESLLDDTDIGYGDTVLEIGPGKGIITKSLARRVEAAGKVVAVELDAQLAKELVESLKRFPQISIEQSDILKFNLGSLTQPYKVFSNIPFNITSELLEFLLNPTNGPEQAHLILQQNALFGRDKRGRPSETLKSLLIKPLYDVRQEFEFIETDFWPQPSVQTALFRFKKRHSPLLTPSDFDAYKDFLAFISRDRVGEGAWLRLLTLKQLKVIAENTRLILNKGLKAQTLEAVVATFKACNKLSSSLSYTYKGAMKKLRAEQKRTESLNKIGGHRRSTTPIQTR